ncbi:Discoidin domain-containing receptor 2, partial [Habropoda laboriosa]
SKRIRIVLGNETCDLDSAISALIQAFSEHLDGLKKGGPKFVVIPLMNISKREYFLRTEVVFYLMQHNITSNLLTFRDQIDLEDLTKNVKKKVEVILVDHHTLPDEDAFLLDSVVKIIDHRPQEPGWLWPDRETHMEIVGSCATLVARNFCDKHPEAVDSRISRLLLGPILVDTFNLSAEAGRAKNEDFQIVSKLESIAFPQVADKGARTAELFHEIIEAKSDISKLTTDDLLIKDLKITAGVPIVGLPILVENFVRLPDSLKALWNFAKSRKAKVVVLMGLEVNSGKLSRDIAVSSFLPYSKDSQDISSYNLRCKVSDRSNSFSFILMDRVEQCILPLGMEEGKIPDDAITASSSYETKSVGPQNARIRQEKNGGAWCPKAQISSAIREYLEIDLTRNHLIAWTETQGRFGNGQGQEYAEAFFLEYWRDMQWHQYKNLKGDRVLRGNSNTYLVEKQKLDLPFVASKVRFVPYSQHPRTVCMRVEIYGCVWHQYLTSYSAPKGSSIGPAGSDLRDSSYDGIEVDDSLLIDGLGQLTDGILAEISEILSFPNPITTSTNAGTNNWVGWSNRSTVRIIFHFQQLREFDNCSLHVARIPELEVETFSMLRVWLSVDGETYQSEPEELEASLDTDHPAQTADTASLSIPLRSRVGRFVKMELSLTAKWLLLSEVTFHTGSSSDSSSRASDQNQSEPRAKSSNSLGTILGLLNETEMYEIEEEASTPDAFPVGTSQTYIGLVSGLLTVTLLFFTCTALLIKQRGRNKVALLQKHTALLCDSSAPKDAKLSNSIVTGLSLIRKPACNAENAEAPQTQPILFAPPRRSSTTTTTTLYERTYKLFSEDNLTLAESNTSARVTESYSDFKCNSSFASNKFNATTYSMSKKPHRFQPAKPNQRVHEGYYAATDILTIKKHELPSETSSSFTPLYIRDKAVRLPRTIDSCNVQRISRHRLRILDKLGEGNFGLVHLCEAKGITNPEMGTIQNRQTVIVRSLWRGVVDALRLDFTKDMHVLAMLRHSNVAKMIALVEEEPFGAVFEYGQYGDLPSFFVARENPDNVIGHFNFLVQIASGMKYLESLNIAHCDLAARNCIVTHNLTIKVSDHAIYCAKYDHHYFIDGYNVKIPLRWMAWEAVLLGKRSCRADIWSFAVTVWEILLDCKETPYPDLTVTQVLENCGRWYQSESYDVGTSGWDDTNDQTNQPRILLQPDRCPDDLYRIMNKCWSKRIEDRPTFEQIHLFLERLTLH